MFAVTGLDKYAVEEEMLRLALAGKKNDTCRKIQTRGKWPLGISGELSFSEKQQDIDQFIARVQAQEMGEKLAGLPLDLVIDGCRLVGTLNNVYEKGVMLVRYGKLRGRDLLSGWLHHLVLNRLQPLPETRIVAEDTIVCFNGTVCSEMQPSLDYLLDCYAKGCRAPSPLYVEPGFAYAKQQASARALVPPIVKARQSYTDSLEKGYELEWQLLAGDQEVEEIIGAEFAQFCGEIMGPIWSAADAC